MSSNLAANHDYFYHDYSYYDYPYCVYSYCAYSYCDYPILLIPTNRRSLGPPSRGVLDTHLFTGMKSLIPIARKKAILTYTTLSPLTQWTKCGSINWCRRRFSRLRRCNLRCRKMFLWVSGIHYYSITIIIIIIITIIIIAIIVTIIIASTLEVIVLVVIMTGIVHTILFLSIFC